MLQFRRIFRNYFPFRNFVKIFANADVFNAAVMIRAFSASDDNAG